MEQADGDRLGTVLAQPTRRARAPRRSSSGFSTSPDAVTRSPTSNRAAAGRATAASSRSSRRGAACASAAARARRGTPRSSRAPSARPRRSSTAFVATVVPWTTASTGAVGAELANGVDDGAVVVRRRREHLREREPCRPGSSSEDVGERAADVGADPASQLRLGGKRRPATGRPRRGRSRGSPARPRRRRGPRRLRGTRGSTRPTARSARPSRGRGGCSARRARRAARPRPRAASGPRPGSRSRGSPSAPAGSRRRPALLGEPVEVAHQHAHPRHVPSVDRDRADARREPLEAEPRRVDLLEVLAREPADERPARVADLDEPLALELREPDPDRRLRDAEPLGEVALHERRALRAAAR